MPKKGKEKGDMKKVLKIIGSLLMYAILSAYIMPLNTEVIIHNWGIGVIGAIIFSVLYWDPFKVDKLLFQPKKLHFFMVVMFTCWIVYDWIDFILFMKGG